MQGRNGQVSPWIGYQLSIFWLTTVGKVLLGETKTHRTTSTFSSPPLKDRLTVFAKKRSQPARAPRATWFSTRPPAGGETASAHHPVTSAPQPTERHPKVPTSGSRSAPRIFCNGWPPRELIPAAVSAGSWDWVEAVCHLPVSVRPSAGSQAGRSCQASPWSGRGARTDPPPGCTTRVRLRTT